MDYIEKIARPLVEYIKNNLHPHAAIVVTDERVQIVEIIQSIPND